MLIRAGYEITYDCAQPTPMLLALSVHPSRLPDVQGPHEIRFDPPVEARNYLDGFGNTVTRLVAPKGRLTISKDTLVRDPGMPDPVVADAEQHPVEDLPDDVLVYLMGSRYCDTDRLSDTAWSLFGDAPLGWAGCRRSATTSTTGSPSATSTPAPPAPPGTGSRSAKGCAATSPTSPSRSAAA